MRLFTALWPPDGAVTALADTTPSVPPRGWRAVDPSTWHITLAFHGDADPGVLARRLDATAHGTGAPRLRLAGSGAFPGVRWAGVLADPPAGLDALVAAAGGDVARFIAHMTVLRLRPRPGAAAEPDPDVPWSAHRGPWWRPGQVLLVASEPARGDVRYRVVHRVPLGP